MRTKLAALSAMVLAGLALAGCAKANDRQLQGWVEAELIFVSPDEQGRVETLKVREGDQVKKGDLLFTVDDDLQKADVVVKKAAVTNAQQAFDRAKELLKTAAGTQKNLRRRRSRPAAGQGQSGLVGNAAGAPRCASAPPTAPSSRSITGRAKPCRPASRWWRCCRRKISNSVSSRRSRCCRRSNTAKPSRSPATAATKGLTAKVSFIARSAEYTPPVIYSLDERAKLVYLIEARPDQPEKFRVGQPVTVTLPQEAPK